METSVSTTNAGVKFGLYTGIASIIISLILYLAGLSDPVDPNPISYVAWLVPVIGVVLGIKYYKDSNEGLLSYGQALGAGTVTALVAGIIGAVYTFIFFEYIDPGMIDAIRENAKTEAFKNPNMTEEQWNQAKGFMETFTSPTVMSIIAIIFNVIVGFITSLIAGAVMKNDQGA